MPDRNTSGIVGMAVILLLLYAAHRREDLPFDLDGFPLLVVLIVLVISVASVVERFSGDSGKKHQDDNPGRDA